MEMKRAVILCLFVLISLVLVVKCGDEDEGDDTVSIGGNDKGVIETVTATDENEVVGDGTDSKGGNDEGDIETDTGTDESEVIGDGTEYDPFADADDEGQSLICLTCKAIIDVMLLELENVDPRKRIEVSSSKSIQYSKSDAYLSEMMEDLCEYEDTLAGVRQVLVQKTLIRKMLQNDGAVEEASESEYTPESFSNENVNYLCLQVMGENDDAILKEFKKEVLPENIREIICTETAKYCKKKDVPEENNDRDEL